MSSSINCSIISSFSDYYDAAGNKLRQDVIYSKNLTKRTDFIYNFVMINNAPAWINFDEGRVIMDGTEVRQVSSYYPIGINVLDLENYDYGAIAHSDYNHYEEFNFKITSVL